MAELEFSEKQEKEWLILQAVGRIDTLTAAEAEKRAMDLLDKQQKMALDLSQLTYISSAGLRVLLKLAKKAQKENKTFTLCGVRGMVQEVLEESGMDMLLNIVPSIESLP